MSLSERGLEARRRRAGAWLAPASEEYSLAAYARVVWSGKWIVLLCLILALVASGVYLVKAPKIYQATSQLLVSPLPSDPATAGLGLVQASSDPLRDVETFAGFVTTPAVAQSVISSLHLHTSVTELLKNVTVTPIAESDIVTIAANSRTPQSATRIADAFATQTIANRTATLHAELNTQIPLLQAQIAALGTNDPAEKSALGTQLAQLETLRVTQDPTLRIETLATVPTSAISPRKSLTLAGGVIGGLVVGIGVVFLMQLFDPRIRNESDLRERFRLPVVARVPRVKVRAGLRRRGPMPPSAITAEATDSYRALRAFLSHRPRESDEGRVVLVTGGSPQDGKSTTAINLAAAFGASGDRVLLLEGDIRRPSIANALHITRQRGLERVLYGDTALEDALVEEDLPTATSSSHVSMLLADGLGAKSAQPMPAAAFLNVLRAARSSNDWVIVDAPPLIYAPDLLASSSVIDDVILVVRLEHTNTRELEETAEMLAQHGITPAGLVVIGTSGHPQYY
jgi:succinoglycan biosynthesis transport protein ExoP